MSLASGWTPVAAQSVSLGDYPQETTQCFTLPHIKQSQCLSYNPIASNGFDQLKIEFLPRVIRAEGDLKSLATFPNVEPRYVASREAYIAAVGALNCRSYNCVGQLGMVVRDFAMQMEELREGELQRIASEQSRNAQLAEERRVSEEEARLEREEAASAQAEKLRIAQGKLRDGRKNAKLVAFIYFPIWMAIFAFLFIRMDRERRRFLSSKYASMRLKDFEQGLNKNQLDVFRFFAVPKANERLSGNFRSYVGYTALACGVALIGAFSGDRYFGDGIMSYVAVFSYWSIVILSFITLIAVFIQYNEISDGLLVEHMSKIANSFSCGKCKSKFSVYEGKTGEDILYSSPQQRSVRRKDSAGNFYSVHENWNDVRVNEHMTRACVKCGDTTRWSQNVVRRENYERRQDMR